MSFKYWSNVREKYLEQNGKLREKLAKLTSSFLLWLFILIISQSYLLPVSAAEINNKLPAQEIVSIRETIREVGEPINLAELNLEYWYLPPENKLRKNDLLKMSKRLRDLARYLGTFWPVIVPLAEGRSLQITDFRKANGDWNTITTGHALRLVTEELQVLENSQTQPKIDLLVRENESYRQLLNVPLIRYCNELFKVIFSD